MSKAQDEEINLLEYGYKQGQMFELPCSAIEELLQLASAFADKEELTGFSHHFAKSKPKMHYSDNKTKPLLAVETEFGVYDTPEPFFNQQPQVFHTLLGVAALDLKSKMQAIKLQHIKEGVAIKKEEIGKLEIVKEDDENFS